MNGAHAGKAFLLLGATLLALLLSACAPRSTPREVKIALVAPFEGEGRPLGYQVLSGVKLALKESDYRLRTGEIVALAALNDDYDPAEAARQVHTADADPEVMAIVGPWSRATASTAAEAWHTGAPSLVIPASLPDDLVLPGRYRLFADDRSLAEAAGREARSIGGCGTILVGSASSPLEGRGCPKGESPHWIMACGSAAGTISAVPSWCRAHPSAGAPILIAGPDAFRLWILPVLPEGMAVRWVTSWPTPGAGFSERFREYTGQDATPEATAAYEAAKLVLSAMSEAAEAGDLSRGGMDRALGQILSGKEFPAHVIVERK